MNGGLISSKTVCTLQDWNTVIFARDAAALGHRHPIINQSLNGPQGFKTFLSISNTVLVKMTLKPFNACNLGIFLMDFCIYINGTSRIIQDSLAGRMWKYLVLLTECLTSFQLVK